MRVEVLFWVSLVLCIGSFLLMAFQIYHQSASTRHSPPAGGIGAAQPQSLNPKEIIDAVGSTAGAFAKAGPIASSAVLCVMFALIALITSGAVEISAGG